MDEEQQNTIDVEQLRELLDNYFYTKDEQEEQSTSNIEISSNNTQALIEKLDEVKQANQFNSNLLYLDSVVVLGIFILFLYYRFLAHFRERWL